MLSRVFVLQLIVGIGKKFLVQIDKIKGSTKERFHAVHQFEFRLMNAVLFTDPLDGHFHFQNFTIPAQHLLWCMNFNEMYALRLFTFQLQSFCLQICLERTAFVGISGMWISGWIGKYEVDRTFAVLKTTPCLYGEKKLQFSIGLHFK